MDKDALRNLFRTKFQDGRLPIGSALRVWGGRGNGQTCDACEMPITKDQLAMEIPYTDGAFVQLHASCFHEWDVERRNSKS